MTIIEAIEKAVEGGWTPKDLKPNGRAPSWIKQAAVSRSKFVERYLLDPAFWRALGKTEGWEDRFPDRKPDYYTTEWFGNMHRLIDHLADGGSIESYFATL